MEPPKKDQTLADRIGKIARLETELMRKAAESMIREESLSHSDFFVIGALKRTLAQSQGFRDLIASKNFPCAAAILRMQIDTAMRVNALLLVEDRDASCKAVLDGKKFNTLKDSAGNKLNDVHLRKKLAEKHPWVSRVYEQASDFVHLSGRHFYSSIASTDDTTHMVYFSIGATDPSRPDSTYFEIVDVFFDISKLVALMLLGYLRARAALYGNKPIMPESALNPE
jgi:hypothetical protein